MGRRTTHLAQAPDRPRGPDLREACAVGARLQVKLAGPGLRMWSTSPPNSQSFLTAAIAAQPGRLRIAAFFTFLPHHDAKTTSGSRRATSDGSTIRSRARLAPASSGKTGWPPAISTSSSTQRIPEISRLSHSSKNTRVGRGKRAADSRMRIEIGRQSGRKHLGRKLTADQAAEHSNHLQDLGDAALIERHHSDAATHELGPKICL